MKTNFIVNDYALIWTILFQGSLNKEIYNLKRKMWENHREEYNIAYKDKNKILMDPKNFIPDNDTVYNLILENEHFERIKKNVDKYRRNVMKIWDSKNKTINYLFEKIIRKEINPYNILVVSDDNNVIDNPILKGEVNSLILGKKIDEENKDEIICDILMEVVNKEIKQCSLTNENIRTAIIELAVLNEFRTKLYNKRCYITGTLALNNIKRSLYPYWLMYLGIPKKDFYEYMEKDNISFNAEKYAYEKQFVKMNLEEFIDFVIRNKKIMVKEEPIEKLEII